MAIPTNIKTLLSGEVVEWARIEFKETWDPAASLKTVCAFTNLVRSRGLGDVYKRQLYCHRRGGREWSPSVSAKGCAGRKA